MKKIDHLPIVQRKPRPSDSRNDEESIMAVMTATTDAFSRHDAKAWVKFCTPDAQLVTVRGESMKGIAEREKGLTTIFQTRGRNVALKARDVTVRFIRPDVALAPVTNELSGLASPEGQTLPPHQELTTCTGRAWSINGKDESRQLTCFTSTEVRRLRGCSPSPVFGAHTLSLTHDVRSLASAFSP